MVPESKTTTRAAEAQYVNGVDGPQPLRPSTEQRTMPQGKSSKWRVAWSQPTSSSRRRRVPPLGQPQAHRVYGADGPQSYQPMKPPSWWRREAAKRVGVDAQPAGIAELPSLMATALAHEATGHNSRLPLSLGGTR